MRMSEIRKFSNLLKYVNISPDALQKFSEGMEWSDIPFPNLKSVETGTLEDCMESGYRKPDRREGKEGEWCIFEKTPDKDPTWMELLILVDEVVGRSGDTHHRFFEEFEYQDDRLKVVLGS
jgi:hypothetical protein